LILEKSLLLAVVFFSMVQKSSTSSVLKLYRCYVSGLESVQAYGDKFGLFRLEKN